MGRSDRLEITLMEFRMTHNYAQNNVFPNNDGKFKFQVSARVFEKADAEPGKTKRIGGIISTETPDRQGEVVLADGLDLDPFLSYGWFNDNHSKATNDILGFPKSVKRFEKGEKLPDGTVSPAKGVWCEGYLLDTQKGREVWELGRKLDGTGRNLAFSVEGKILERKGPKTIEIKGEGGQSEYVGKVVAKAEVRQVAICATPVNSDAKLVTLEKSLITASQSGGASDSDSLTDAEAVTYTMERIPGISPELAHRFVCAVRTLKHNNKL